MRKFLVVLGALLLFHASPSLAQPTGGDARQRFSQLPLHFEANEGQIDPRAKFVGRGDGYDVFLTPTETVLALAGGKPGTAGPVVRMRLVGANPQAPIAGRDKQPGVVNYFVGQDPARWRKNVPTYARVHYDDVYPGIDAIFYGQRRQLEYDLVVAPGANAGLVRLEFDGADDMRVDADGDLVLRTRGNDLRLRKPVIYQNVKGVRKPIAGAYALSPKTRQVTFTVGDYDRSLPLVIDPVLAIVYSSLLGGTDPFGFFSMTSGQAIAVDAAGSAYVVGMTTATDFPTVNALQSTRLGSADAFIVKYHPSGSSLVYATYFGGSAGGGSGEFEGPPTTIAYGVVVDAGGNAYVTGTSTATDLPTINAYQSASAGDSDAFVIKLNETGSTLLYSSYLGGSGGDGAEGIVLGPDGAAFVTGSTASTNFPSRNAFQPDLAGSGDAFVAKIDTAIAGDGSLVYSTYLGGPQNDAAQAIAVDADGNAHVAGIASAGFPVLNGVTLTGSGLFEAFLSKVSFDGTLLLYSTLLGGSDTEQANAVAIDAAGNTYLTGWTTSTDFLTKNALQPTIDGFQDAFLAKVNTLAAGDASLLFSTFFGGDNGDEGTALAIDGDGMVVLAGVTASPDFVLVSPLFYAAGSAYVARFGPTGALDFSTRLGENDQARPLGIAVDPARDIYVTGELFLVGAEPLFPATPGTFQGPVPADSGAAFVTKIATGTQFGLNTVIPNHGGNTGYASVMLRGEGFDPTTTVKLVRPGQADIIGRVVLVSTGLLSVTFDLHDAPLGVYDVVVTNAERAHRHDRGRVHRGSGRAAEDVGRYPRPRHRAQQPRDAVHDLLRQQGQHRRARRDAQTDRYPHRRWRSAGFRNAADVPCRGKRALPVGEPFPGDRDARRPGGDAFPRHVATQCDRHADDLHPTQRAGGRAPATVPAAGHRQRAFLRLSDAGAIAALHRPPHDDPFRRAHRSHGHRARPGLRESDWRVRGHLARKLRPKRAECLRRLVLGGQRARQCGRGAHRQLQGADCVRGGPGVDRSAGVKDSRADPPGHFQGAGVLRHARGLRARGRRRRGRVGCDHRRLVRS